MLRLGPRLNPEGQSRGAPKLGCLRFCLTAGLSEQALQHGWSETCLYIVLLELGRTVVCRVPAPLVQSSVTLTGNPRLRVMKQGNEQVTMERLLCREPLCPAAARDKRGARPCNPVASSCSVCRMGKR